MPFGPLVSAGWLAGHLEHEGLHVVDCRWYLGEPERGPATYHQSHIPGAIYMDLDRDLSAPVGPGRHPLPDPDIFMETLRRAGIEPGSVVVAYDDRGGAVASRLWWMLRDLGHKKVAVLDGGLAAWPTPLMDNATVTPAAVQYHAEAGQMPRIDRDALAATLHSVLALDARAGERYRGEEEPIDPVAGHIPTAVNRPLTDNLTADGRFRPASELADQFADLTVAGGSEAVSYCGSGVTACHNILALEVAGLGTATLYPGSWSDWSTAGMPVQVGPDPGSWPVR
ncbi:MAG: sulfurtransferase [bacterium]|nr:sulfurtransferase [bacterium]